MANILFFAKLLLFYISTITQELTVLHLIPSLSGGGMERRMNTVSDYTASKCRVHVAYILKGPNHEDIYFKNIVPIKIKAKNNYDPRIIFQIIFLIYKLKPNIIQTWSEQMDLIGGLLSFIFNIHIIIMEPISPKRDYARKNTIRTRLKFLFARRAHIISNSEEARVFWSKKVVKGSHLIRNGYSISHFNSLLPSKIIKKNTFHQSTRFLVCASRLTSSALHKNVETVIRSLKLVIQDYENLVLVLCGDGPYRAKYQQLALELNLDSHIIFTGFLKRRELWSLFRSSDLFISLSDYEGMPNTVVEAAICEVPLLLSSIPTHLEIISAQSAYYLESKDPSYVAKSIINCLEDKESCIVRTLNARKDVNDFTLSKMIESYLNLYKDIVK